MVQREVEGVEVAPAPLGSMSRQLAVDDQRHALLGDAAVRAQRRVERPRGRGARPTVPITVERSETTTRSPMRSGGSSKRGAASARVQHRPRCPAARASALASAGRVGAVGQVDRGERAERAVVDDVGVGDRQDHARTRRRRASRRARPAGRSRRARRRHPRLGVHAVVGGERDRRSPARPACRGSRPSSRRTRRRPSVPGACLCCT